MPSPDAADLHVDSPAPVAGVHDAAGALMNRAMLNQTAGRVRQALADFDQCAAIGQAYELVAKALHGRGRCEVLTGDITAALRDFDAAGAVYARHGEGMLGVLAVDKARALLVAGLPSEAATELDSALDRLPLSGMDQEHAEAELTRAEAALAAGNQAAARTWAARARWRFERRGNETWAAVATLLRLRAEFEAGGRAGSVAVAAAALADRLRRLGLRNDCDAALLLSARAHIALGELDEAAARLAGRDRPDAPLPIRLLRRLASAELSAARGERRKTFARAGAGLALLRAHREQFGSLDLRTGTASLGGELARIGLAAAMETADPPVVFRWLERSRAQAFHVRPVHTPADERTVDAVAELRELAHQVRIAELAGRREPELRRRCVELERWIRAKDWQTDGTGEHHGEATYHDVCAGLSDAGSAMISFLVDGDRLKALVIVEGRAALTTLGEPSRIAEALARLRSDLNALCGRQLPAALREVIHSSAAHQLEVLTEQVLAPLISSLGDFDVVVVPTGELSSMPWGLLPALRGRPVTVAPSPSAWLAARSSRSEAAAGSALVVVGPALEHASDEADRLGGIYPGGTVLRGNDATVEATLKAVGESTIVHFAAHGHHERENVLFSRLDLVDGPLMAYDIHQLRSVPEHVVLSACDIGRAVVRAGDEILGFTAALLYSGSRTVVSSVARVDDQAVVGVMGAYHEALARGVPASKALADAAAVEPLMPFVCFGAA